VELAAAELKLSVHTAIGLKLEIPERLRDDFRKASRSHEHDLHADWGAEIRWWQEQPMFPPAPEVPAAKVDHEQYEYYCRDLLLSVGYSSATVTRYRRDGGIDVESDELVVQCKHYTGSVGVREVREVFGIAQHRGKTAVVITSGSFTADAAAFARDAGVGLIHYDEMVGRPKLLNAAAREVWDQHNRSNPPTP
jgi:restriction system protein